MAQDLTKSALTIYENNLRNVSWPKEQSPDGQIRPYFVNGFSGHGVMHSPASGRIAADLVLEGHSGLIDATQLRVERFAEGRTLEETAVL